MKVQSRATALRHSRLLAVLCLCLSFFLCLLAVNGEEETCRVSSSVLQQQQQQHAMQPPSSHQYSAPCQSNLEATIQQWSRAGSPYQADASQQQEHQQQHSSWHPPYLPVYKGGGIIFFHHIPKAGGTTVRKTLEDIDGVEYIFAKNRTLYNQSLPQVEHALIHGTPNNTFLVLEVHASNSPSLRQLRRRLLRWKQTALSNNVATFFFTVFRSDPIGYALSHFNFFHVQRRNPSFPRLNATLDNFRQHSLHNPQCQFLHGGERSMRASGKYHKQQRGQVDLEQHQHDHNHDDRQQQNDRPREKPSPSPKVERNNRSGNQQRRKSSAAGSDEDAANSPAPTEKSMTLPSGVIVQPEHCDEMYRMLVDTMDWVGTTEKLSNETLPLLLYHILQQPKVNPEVQAQTQDQTEAQSLQINPSLDDVVSAVTTSKTELFRKYRVTEKLDEALVYLKRHNLTGSAIERIQEMTTLDIDLAARIQQYYSLEEIQL